jgi:phosphoglycolate phosphatase-like HAD superfamily hydrolase
MKKIILCDLDGTLADCEHRLHHIMSKPKNWRDFFAECRKDKPIQQIIDLVNALDRNQIEVWITSGRSDECRKETESWLGDFKINYDRLIMRKSGDFTDDGTLKPSWLYDGTIPLERVLLALDDRNRVVDAWRMHGIKCLQVAEGNF